MTDSIGLAPRLTLPSPMPWLRRAGVLAASLLACAAFLALAAPVLAHGDVVPPEPTIPDFLIGWSFDPTIQLPILLAAFLWLAAVRSVDAAHPASNVPRRRTVTFFIALAALEVALQSGIERYDTTLFLDHMVQHVLLIMVAAPFIVLSAPITLALRAARPDVRRSVLLPILHSRIIMVLSHPVVSWLLFAGFLWGSHFSPLFDASLENPLIHDAEHVAFLGTAMLFWWPAAGLDPSPWRMPHPARVLYVFLQMPQNTFLSLTIFSATSPLYSHYVTSARNWGPTVIADQQAAGAFMWVAGDLMFLVAILAVVYDWMRHEEKETVRLDARLDAERAAIREREAALATKHASTLREASASVPTGGSAARTLAPGGTAEARGGQLEGAPNPGDATGPA